MSVLTLRLAGPLQAWGASARFTRRTTEPAPTKSGVIGMLTAARGIQRGDDTALAQLSALRFGVRIDQPGTRIRDFQTAHHADSGKSMPLSERFYLADAVFVAAVEGEAGLLRELHSALRAPVYPPYLGRRSCPPSQPVELGLHDDGELEQVLSNEPWRASRWYRRQYRQASVPLAVLREARPGEQHADVLRDQPLSFAAEHRRHALRSIVRTTVDVPNPQAASPTRSAPAHDPFAALQEESP
ncbi:type I-E CRISPR-associated protein Cas5/CasD [Streptomyces sp. NBC_00568]|uniref:type I-E CRISPR-associated protein Cas5/CasD n=1 Tax=Streptomyces sp. NBC_00568 TaxID=2975779 RepID=UPI002255CE28|nr:type I-E CRISPR-associated protein Cas5/CasD [Streptomyces sp. NBC_00568]MCX4993372.1 type I-E CRISPR-associated protein Cas5/CasD [Streptomyces sp. NBC_00568]